MFVNRSQYLGITGGLGHIWAGLGGTRGDLTVTQDMCDHRSGSVHTASHIFDHLIHIFISQPVSLAPHKGAIHPWAKRCRALSEQSPIARDSPSKWCYSALRCESFHSTNTSVSVFSCFLTQASRCWWAPQVRQRLANRFNSTLPRFSLCPTSCFWWQKFAGQNWHLATYVVCMSCGLVPPLWRQG